MAKLLLLLFLLVGLSETTTRRRRSGQDKCRSRTYEIECGNFTDADSLPDAMRSFKTSLDIRGNFSAVPLRDGGADFARIERIRTLSRHPDFPDCARLSALLLTFPRLVKLDLRDGVLATFDFSCLPSRQLSVVDLSANGISTLRGCDALRRSELREIHLSGNRLTQFDLSCLPSTLQILRLESNRIATLRAFARLRDTQIRKIYLQLNRIAEFDFGALPSHLMKIDLNFNRITRLDLTGLRVSDRTKLFIFDNPINETCGLLSDIYRLVAINRVGLYLDSTRWDPRSDPRFGRFGCYATVGEDQVSTRVVTAPTTTEPQNEDTKEVNSSASLKPSFIFYLFVSLVVSPALTLF